MDLTPDQMLVLRLRNGLIRQTARWKNNIVDYVITGDFCKLNFYKYFKKFCHISNI